VFFGGHGSGKALHVDQVLWQNLGKNWAGYKLIAAFGVQDISDLLDNVPDCMFLPEEDTDDNHTNAGANGKSNATNAMEIEGANKSDTPKPKTYSLPPVEAAFLDRAIGVVMIRPGDLFCFTGGVPHVTCSVGPEMNICAYESYVTLNKSHVLHFLSGSKQWSGFDVKGLECKKKY
jgi:hypothetical protein